VDGFGERPEVELWEEVSKGWTGERGEESGARARGAVGEGGYEGRKSGVKEDGVKEVRKNGEADERGWRVSEDRYGGEDKGRKTPRGRCEEGERTTGDKR
jgi:hypothetical protein